MLGLLAKVLGNAQLISQVVTATLTVAESARRRSREAAGETGGEGADVEARLGALEEAMRRESQAMSSIAAQLEGTASALQGITRRLTLALVVASAALVVVVAALLLVLLR